MGYILKGRDLNILIGNYCGMELADIYVWQNHNPLMPGREITFSELERSVKGSVFAILRYDECKRIYVNKRLVWDGMQNYLGHGNISIHFADGQSRQRIKFLTRHSILEMR